MQEPENFICIREVPNPRIPRRVSQPITQSSKDERYHKHREWRMNRVDHIRNQVETRAENRDSPLAQPHVDCMVEQSCDSIANQRRKKHERDNCVGEVVVSFELFG